MPAAIHRQEQKGTETDIDIDIDIDLLARTETGRQDFRHIY